MKQTNNAIKFLMAQYRAIFKNAYFKGLTSAVLLTAVLAVAGGAQAASYNSIDSVNAVEDELVKIDGTASTPDSASIQVESGDVLNKDLEFTIGSGSDFTFTASGTANTTVALDGNGHDITINGSRDSGTKQFYFGSSDADEKLQIKNLGTLTIQKNATVTVSAGSGGTTAGVDVYADTINVDNAIVNILQHTSGGNSTTGQNAILRGKTITVTGKDAVINLGSLYNDRSSGGRATLGWRSDAKLVNDVPVSNNAGSDISFSNGATLNLLGRTGTGATATAYNTEGSQVWGNSLTTNDSYVEVSGAGAQIQTHTNTFTNTNFHVANKAQLIIKPYEFRVLDADGGTNDDNVYSYINGTTTFDGGNLIVEGNLQAAGTVVINDSVNLTAGNAALNTADNAEDNELYNGVLTIGMGESFTTETDKAVDTQSTLKISSTKLNEFLKASNTNTEFKNAQGQTQTYVDKAGILSFGAGKVTLAFTDTTQVDMHQFNWVKTDMSTSGSSNAAVAGSIVYDNSLTGKETSGDYAGLPVGVTVTATDMRIARTLGTGASEITYEADRMTLGSDKGDSTVEKNWQGFESSAAGLGVKAIVAHDELNLVDGLGNDYTLQDTVTLERDFYTKDASGNYTTTATAPGLIKGDNLVIGGDSDSGTMTISGGAFVNEGQSLTISSGDLTVGAVANLDKAGTAVQGQGKDDHGDWTYYKNANPASLTWTGVFDIAGTAGTDDATISVKGASGATATLDLTGASVKWGSGSITLQGAVNTDNDPYRVSATDYFAVGGEGVLTITGNQFSDYLDIQTGDDTETATDLTISGGGVLLVEGAVTGAINFNKFSSTTSGAGTVYFNNGGRLVSTGELSLETGVATTVGGDPTTTSLDLGEGAIIAQGITINNRNPELDAADADLADDYVTVSGGALAVASRLATSNNEIKFNDASLVLDSNGFTRYGLSATEGGAVSAAKLTFSGDGSTFEVVTDDWTVGANGKLGDVDVIESGNVVIGADAGEYIRNNIGASLQIDNLSLAGTPTGASNLEVKDGGELTVNTIQAANTSLSVTGGTLTINGRELVAADFESESEPESLVDLGEEDGIAQAGIDLTGATINVSNQGHFVLGDTAANALVKFTPTATDTVDVVEVNEALDSANITLSNGSEFRLDFASGTASTINGGSGLTAEQAAMLKDKLGTFEGGSYVNVGQLALNMKYDKETLTAQWSDIKDFVQVESDVVNNDIKQLLVQGITSSDEISGHFGAVEADVVGQNTIRVNGNLGLHKAYDGYFASVVNANGQRSEVGLTLTTYSTVQLEGAGTVGTLEGQGTGSDSDVVFAEGEYYLVLELKSS